MQVHYFPNGEEQLDQTRVGLHFATEPIEFQLISAPIVNFSFYLPAGKAKQKVVANAAIPQGVPIKLVGVTPHMHLLGQQIKLEATLPGGEKACLINIPKWEFKWQGTYTYKDFLSLPGGTKLKLTSYYDNSEKNPLNPNSPPKAVTWGERTTDEMCLAFISFIVDYGKKGSSISAATMNAVDKQQLEDFIGPPIMMNGVNLTERALMRFQSSMFSSSPVEMYNWSDGFTKKELNLLPWKKANPEVPGAQEQQHCH